MQRQGVEQTANGRAGDVGDLEDRGSPGDGVHEVFGRNQVGQQRRACRAAEGTAAPDQEEHGENRPDPMQSPQGENQQGQGAEHLQYVADQDHLAAVVTVGDVAGGQQEQKPGQKEHQPGIAQVDRPMGDFIYLPGDSDCLRFCAHDDHDPGQLIAAKVSISECGCTCCRWGHRPAFLIFDQEDGTGSQKDIAPVAR